MYKVFKPALPFAGACLAASPWLPGWACIWLATATTAELMSQQFHAWAHMKKSELPPAVIALQVCAAPDPETHLSCMSARLHRWPA